jgi:hypothetical protein
MMQRLHKQTIPVSTTNRSRVTNGSELLQGIDGRSPLARRFRDVLRGLLTEFDVDTEAENILIRQAVTLTLLSERLQSCIVRDEPVDPAIVMNLAGALRRSWGRHPKTFTDSGIHLDTRGE